MLAKAARPRSMRVCFEAPSIVPVHRLGQRPPADRLDESTAAPRTDRQADIEPLDRRAAQCLDQGIGFAVDAETARDVIGGAERQDGNQGLTVLRLRAILATVPSPPATITISAG